MNFHDYSTQEDYDRFIREATGVSGLVIFYDNLFSTSRIRKLLKSEGNNKPRYSDLTSKWNNIQAKYVACLFDALLPLTARKQIYCAFMTDLTNNAVALHDVFGESLDDNDWSRDNLHPNIFQAVIDISLAVCYNK